MLVVTTIILVIFINVTDNNAKFLFKIDYVDYLAIMICLDYITMRFICIRNENSNREKITNIKQLHSENS